MKKSGNQNESSAIAAAIENSKPKTNDSSSLSQWASSAASILNEESKTVDETTNAPKTVDEVKEIENVSKIFKKLHNSRTEIHLIVMF